MSRSWPPQVPADDPAVVPAAIPARGERAACGGLSPRRGPSTDGCLGTSWVALLALPLLLGAAASLAAELPPPRPATWTDIDTLRALLMANGTRVVQSDCRQPGLQGLYHNSSDTIVICRVHRDPQAVWNTLAHEATHRMQACAGGSITKPSHHQSMARALASHAPEEWRSLRIYPSDQQLSELEARYTARLPPETVARLFRRYCGGGPSAPGSG